MTDTNTISKILELREHKMSYAEISRELSITKDTARYQCIAHGLDIVTDDKNSHIPDELGEKIKDMYLNNGMTPSEIAVALKRSPQGIRKYLLRHEIKKPRAYTPNKDSIDKIKLPDPIVDPVYYPDRKVTPKKVSIKGKEYQDISEAYGIWG